MFWRQIPRATNVLANRNPDLESPSSSHHRPDTSHSSNIDENVQVPYSSREGGREFNSKQEWKKAIQGVMEKEDLKHVRGVVEAAVAVERDNKKKLKGYSVRLRRKSSAARMRPKLDLEDESPDPITLAKVTPFSASPPASLCGGGTRDESDSDTANSRRSRMESTRESFSFADDSRLPLPSSTSNPAPPTRPSSVSPPRRAPSVASSDDDSTLPPYEPSDRYSLVRPSLPARSVTTHAPVLPLSATIPRPQLDHRTTVADPSSQFVPLPLLPPLPPPPPFPVSRTVGRENDVSRSNDHDDETTFAHQARQPFTQPREISRRRSTVSIRHRSDRVAYHSVFGMSGLTNLGNSCYLSALIQGLAATDVLSEFLASGEYRNEVNRENRNGTQGQIAEALAVLFKAMSSGRHRVITAGRFRDIISSASQFDNYDQQDAHDFLLYLLDAIHEDLNLLVHAPSPLEEDSPEHQYDLDRLHEVVAADREWAKYRDRNDSIVIDFFQGQLRNRMECLYCQETSTTYNPLQTLPLPIPEQQGDNAVQLEDCIDEFLREEILEGENAWNCPQCRRPRTASKQLAITRLPKILIIQLKRFTSYSSFSAKVETNVDFPLEDLDLGYLLPPKSTSNRFDLNLPHEANTNYELYALVNHLGSENTSGHYTAIVRKGDTFLEIDDESITPVPASELVDRCASSVYLLFYRLSSDRNEKRRSF
ncbi:uncharacterized protein JCM6883_003102 [Sporobolomyces salmoneus]|uniref:uncharacterized protein n=1 Tax=Sporobolomyces salmoneus TaxID=183962 RepID=UPI00317FBE2D